MKDSRSWQDLRKSLKQFTGTSAYTRYGNNLVLTDGALFLAEIACCYWLIDLFASHLLHVGKNENFVCLKLIKINDSAQITIDDGNGRVLGKQFVGYTDFPLTVFNLYGGRANERWIVMLPSEY